MTRTTTPAGLRRANRAAVLRPILLEGPQYRVGLARKTGLSSATVTNVVGELLDEALVLEVGVEESAGGRPRVLLRPNPDFGIVIGVDVGETGLRVEAFDLALAKVADRQVAALPQEQDARSIVASTAVAIEDVRAELEGEGRRILGVGVGVPGVVEHDRDLHVHAPSVGWEGVPLRALFRERIEVPLAIDNGAKTLGRAEMWLGAGRGY